MADYEALNTLWQNKIDPFTPHRYRQFFRYFPRSAEKVLDVGCGMGRGGAALKGLSPALKIFGLDCLKDSLEKIPPRIYENMLCSYSSDINIQDQFFDVIVAGEFIEHVYSHEIMKTLQEFYRIIKTSGRLLLTTPNPGFLYLRLTGKTVLGEAHISEHHPKELKNRLEEVGFKDIKIYGSGRVSLILGENFPLFSFYGSYLAVADKI